MANRQRQILLVVLSLLAAVMVGAAEPAADEAALLTRAKQSAAEGRLDPRLTSDIGRLPREKRPAVAKELAASASAAVRAQAVIILQNYPPATAGEVFTKLLDDPSPDLRLPAAIYLAREAKHAGARRILLAEAGSPDVARAARGLEALGQIGGEDVAALLKARLEAPDTPRELRLAALRAAAVAGAKPCGSAIAGLLTDTSPARAGDPQRVRVCDLAAQALEAIYRVNQTSTPNVYLIGSEAARDQGIKVWREWFARQGAEDHDPQATALTRLVEEAQAAVAADDATAKLRGLKPRLLALVGTAFCLGDLPGINRVVVPVMAQECRVLRAVGREASGVLNPWQRLQGDFQAGFVGDGELAKLPPDEQAWRFVRFATGQAYMRPSALWSLGRSLLANWPESRQRAAVEEAQRQLLARLAERKQQLVLHGDLPIIEPVPPPPRNDNVTPDAETALDARMQAHPSNWAYHREAVAFCLAQHVDHDEYPFLSRLRPIDPANEWLYLGSAVYELHVKHRPPKALAYAETAVLLNPANTKGYFVRGIARLAANRPPAEVCADLLAVLDREPAALGGEPETFVAAALLMEHALNVGDQAMARARFGVLAPLLLEDQRTPLAETQRFADYRRRLGLLPR